MSQSGSRKKHRQGHPGGQARTTRSSTAPTSDDYAVRRQESWHHRRVSWLQGSRERWQHGAHWPSCRRRPEEAIGGDNKAAERLIRSRAQHAGTATVATFPTKFNLHNSLNRFARSLSPMTVTLTRHRDHFPCHHQVRHLNQVTTG